MSPSAKKQFNTSIGSLFLVLGVVAWGVAAYFAVKPADQKRLPSVVLAPSVDINACRQALATLYGFNVRPQGRDLLVVTTQDISNPQKVLVDATSAMGVCKRELVEFCMGMGCNEPGMTMTLGLPENQKRVPGVATRPALAASEGIAVRPKS